MAGVSRESATRVHAIQSPFHDKEISMARVNPIPQGFTAVTPQLVCARAADAIEFYKKAFGAAEESRLPGQDGKIMHAVIRIGGSPIMLSEERLDWGAVSPRTPKGPPGTIPPYRAGTGA